MQNFSKMIPVDILKIIPQRPPFVIVDHLINASEKTAETSFLITKENIFVENGFLSEAGLMENIAQTAAAKSGYESFKKNMPVERGYIVAVKNFEVFSLPAVQQEIHTAITIRDIVMNIMVVDATVENNEKIIAKCEMNIMIEKTEREVFIIADNIISPLGNTTTENFTAIKNGETGIKKHFNAAIADKPFYASLFEPQKKFIENELSDFTKFEVMLIATISNTIQQTEIDIKNEKLILIISSTKGNISLLETETYNLELENRIALHTSAKKVADYFGLTQTPVVISNACISGIAAIISGKRLLDSGLYEHAIIAGADVITKFILSGFESFQAISDGPCKPFDKNRNGITLGEAAASLMLSVFSNEGTKIKVMGGSVSNDANHISAPSRTGEELSMAIENALNESHINTNEINFISAHGTATIYNDEMESKALHLSGLEKTPVNSLKGFFGHTLGAAGLVESIISITSMKENTMIPTKGFEKSGKETSLNICQHFFKDELKTCLKTASGFGGCNAAVVFSKIEK